MAADSVTKRLQLILGIDSKKFKSDLGEVEGKIQTFSHSINTAMKRAALGLIGSGGLFTLMVKGAVEGASKNEEFVVSLTNIYKSVDIANAKFKQYQKLAITMPFNIDELIRADIALTRYSLDVDHWLPILGEWATATKSLGTDLGSLTDIMGKLQQGGAGAGRAFMAILQAGVTKKELAQYGVMFDELNGKLLSSTAQTMIGMERLIKDKFGGSMERAESTFRDAWEDLIKVWKQVEAVIAKPLMEKLKSDLREVMAWFERIRESGQLDVWIKKAQDVLLTAYDAVKKLGVALYDLAIWLSNKVKWLDKNVGLENVFIVAVFVMAAVKIASLIISLTKLVTFIQGNSILMGLLGLAAPVAAVAAAGAAGYGLGKGIDALIGDKIDAALDKLGILTYNKPEKVTANIGQRERGILEARSWYAMQNMQASGKATEAAFANMGAGGVGTSTSDLTSKYSQDEIQAIQKLKFAYKDYYQFRTWQISRELDSMDVSEQLKSELRAQEMQALATERDDFNAEQMKMNQNALDLELSQFQTYATIKVDTTKQMYSQIQDAVDNGLMGYNAKSADQIVADQKKLKHITDLYDSAYRNITTQGIRFVQNQISMGNFLKNVVIQTTADMVKGELQSLGELALAKAALAMGDLQFGRAAQYMAAAALTQIGSAFVQGLADKAMGENQQPAQPGVGSYDGGAGVGGGGGATTNMGTSIRGQQQIITISPSISITGDTILIGNLGIQELKNSIAAVAVQAVQDALATGEIVVH